MLIGFLEDDLQQASLVKEWLEEFSLDVVHSTNVADFKVSLQNHKFDLLILDWELPDGTGLEVLNVVRSKLGQTLPVLFCTQRDNENDVAKALELGADDYMRKPISKVELKARIQALLRRVGGVENKQVFNFGPYRFDINMGAAFHNEKPVNLTEKDFELAVCLFRNNGRVLSRNYLLESVWGVNASLNTRTVDVHVSRIRKSLGISAGTGYRIKTVYQHGYRLEKIDVKESIHDV